MGDVIEFDKGKQMSRPGGSIEGPLTAFYFSRKSRAERIATTLGEILKAQGGFQDSVPYDVLLAIGTALEPYALKDFAVRYGHLEDGHAKP